MPDTSTLDTSTLIFVAFSVVFGLFVVLAIRAFARKRRAELTSELERPRGREEEEDDEDDRQLAREALAAKEGAPGEEADEQAAGPTAGPGPAPIDRPRALGPEARADRKAEKKAERAGKQEAHRAAEVARLEARAAEEAARAREAAEAQAQAQADAEAEAKKKKKLVGKSYKEGLEKTRGGFIARLGALLTGKKEIDAQLLGQLEEVLFTADIGVKTSQKLFGAVKEALSRKELTDADKVWAFIRREAERILNVDAPALDPSRAKPFVILTIGVNGAGKTTTIGKLAARYHDELGAKVVLAAGDTFRAAAEHQLEIWGDRAGAEVVRGKEGADPSSVIFEGVKKGKENGADIVIADTAGRLHTKVNLMEELKKIRRVITKAMEGAPHETFLVLDATNGQNAIAQAQMFKQTMDITGIVLTKMDGTAKGGVILGICDELQVPVRYVGIGERVEDLKEFDPHEFVAGLFGGADAADDG